LPSLPSSDSPSLLPLIQSSDSSSLLPSKQSSDSPSKSSELSESPSFLSTPTSGGHGQLRYTPRWLYLLSFTVVLFP
jgi:hypothetical protein